jgi:hypothetical protein
LDYIEKIEGITRKSKSTVTLRKIQALNNTQKYSERLSISFNTNNAGPESLSFVVQQTLQSNQYSEHVTYDYLIIEFYRKKHQKKLVYQFITI